MDINNYKNILGQKSQLKSIIHNNGKKILYQKNDTIVKNDDLLQYVFYLEKGRVKFITLIENGTNLLITSKNSGFLGAIPIMRGSINNECDIISETISEVYAIKISTFFYLLNSSILFRCSVLNELSLSMMYEAKKNINSNMYTSKDFLYSYLVENINYNELIEGCWYNIIPQYSQQDYADILGVTRMTIFNIINKLCKEKKIRLINNKIQVKICEEDSMKLR